MTDRREVLKLERKTLSLTEGPVLKSVIYFAAPILVSNLFQQLYNAVDSMVTGRFAGSLALAAVGSTGALINLMIGFFLGIANGTGVLFARYYGAKDYGALKKVMDAALMLSIGAGIFITVPGILFAPQLLLLMNTPEDVLPMAVIYLRIYLAGTIVNLIYNTGAGIICAAGDSKRPLLYLVCGGVTNLILDLVFVALLGWGIAGAALATVLAQLVSAIPVVRHLLRFPQEFRLRPLHMELDRGVIGQVVRVAIPCGLQSSMFNISNLLVQVKINSFGSTVMAGITAYTRIDGFLYMPMMALSMSCSTYVGQNFGAGKYDRARRGVRICLISALICSATLAVCVMLSASHLLHLFTTDAEAIGYGRMMMWFMCPFGWTFVFSDVLGGAVQGSGHPAQVTAINGMCICLYRIIWLTVLLHFFHDIRIVLLCYPTSWVLCSLTEIVYYLKFSEAHKLMHGRI